MEDISPSVKNEESEERSQGEGISLHAEKNLRGVKKGSSYFQHRQKSKAPWIIVSSTGLGHVSDDVTTGGSD